MQRDPKVAMIGGATKLLIWWASETVKIRDSTHLAGEFDDDVKTTERLEAGVYTTPAFL